MNNKQQDIRKMTRTVFRQNDIDIIMKSKDSTVVAKDVRVNPTFASTIEKISNEKHKKLEEALKVLPDIVEVWTPPVSDTNNEIKKEETKKQKKTKKKTILEIKFIADKNFNIDVEFKSAITV